jgi:hypothetical protein
MKLAVSFHAEGLGRHEIGYFQKMPNLAMKSVTIDIVYSIGITIIPQALHWVS